MRYKIMLSLMITAVFSNNLFCSLRTKYEAIRVDGLGENGEIAVNFLVALSDDKKPKEHVKNFKVWRQEQIHAYKSEYHISDSDCTVEDAYQSEYLNTHGRLHPDCYFPQKSQLKIIPIALAKYEINCSCQYVGYPQWNMRALAGYSQAEVVAMAEQIRK